MSSQSRLNIFIADSLDVYSAFQRNLEYSGRISKLRDGIATLSELFNKI